MFFMVCFIFIIATQSLTETGARRREFDLRSQERNIADELSDHALRLEVEVERRSKQQAATEERYQQLFNQIADDVVVIDQEGIILQSNTSFELNYGTEDNTLKPRCFYDLTISRQRMNIEKEIEAIIHSGKSLSAYQLCLKKTDGTVTDAEMSGSVLQRDGGIIGILITIRDISIRKSMELKLMQSLELRKNTESAAILALAKLSEFKDVVAGNHLERIREYCKILATELSTYRELQGVMTPQYQDDIFHASILHDIGKVAVPDELLLKKSLLKEQEREQVRRHTIVGGDFIREMEDESESSSFLTMAKHIAYFHHEQWDGNGYPYGLMGREIPLAARIMAVADTYDEMTSVNGSSKRQKSHEETLLYIVNNAAIQFDPIVVKAFTAAEASFAQIRVKLTEQENHAAL